MPKVLKLAKAGKRASAPQPPTVDEALAVLRRIEPVHLLDYAANFERQAAPHPESKTRLALAMAVLLRAVAAEPPPPATVRP